MHQFFIHNWYTMKIILFALFFSILFAQPSLAASSIRDAEVEEVLYGYLGELSNAAGMPTDYVKLVIVADNNLNAFVNGGSHIFINTGLLLESDNPETVIGVMAHELGHISGGHIIKIKSEAKNAMATQIIGLGLGIAAAVAGERDVALASVSAGSHLANRDMLSFSRSQEQYADQHAVEYMHKAGYSLSGLLSILEKFRRSESMVYGSETGYMRTHPLSKDRIAYLRANIGDGSSKIDESMKYKYKMMLAKLRGFMWQPTQTIRYYNGQSSDDAVYAKSIAYFRQSNLNKAIDGIGGLIKKNPENYFLHDLQGQIYFENGQIDNAINAYSDAYKMQPKSSLIALGYAQSLIARADKSSLAKALPILDIVEKQERDSPLLWNLKAESLLKLGDRDSSELARAELAMLQKKYDDAIAITSRLKNAVATDSSIWLKANDIALLAKQKRSEKNAQ